MRRFVLLLLLALTACTGGSSEPTSGTSSKTPSASASASASASSVVPSAPAPSAASSGVPDSDLLMAVAGGPGQLSLYAVTAGTHSAHLVRRLEGPRGMTVDAVSVSGGPAPAVCAVWRPPPSETADFTNDLVCYRSGAVRGRLIVRDVRGVAVRADGRALAWTEINTDAPLVVADLVGDAAKERSREPYVEGGAPDGGYPEAIGELTWLGPRTLAGTDDADSDEGRGVCLIDAEQPRTASRDVGFGRCLHPDPEEGRKGYARFQDAVPAEDGVLVTIERAMWCCTVDPEKDPGARAVRVRMSDGAVLGIVATPREGRDVVEVTGGRRAVVYLTRARSGGPGTVSLRWADEGHGAPVTGLPTGVTVVAAQP